MNTRGQRKEQIGTVISDRMQKTIIVMTESLIKHPKYGKFIKRKAKFSAHDEKGVAKMGDVVKIQETRPLSKTKNWKLISVIKKSQLSDELRAQTSKEAKLKGTAQENSK